MSNYDRTSVSLLVVVSLLAVLIRTSSCGDGTVVSTTPSMATQAVIGTVIVTGDSVNLRQAPTRSASVLAQVGRGQELDLLGSQEDWYNVRWGEGTAWLSKLYANPAEDCPIEQTAATEDLRRQMTGEWTGDIGGSPATFVFYTRGERLCAYVLYGHVKETLAVTESGIGTLTLAGKRYERLGGTTGDFSLDTFSGQLDDGFGRLAGTYTDTRNNRGDWFAERPGSASEAALGSTDEAEAQPNTSHPEDVAEHSIASDSPEEISAPPTHADAQAADPGANQPAAEDEEESIVSASEDGEASKESLFLGRWEGDGKQFDSRERWRLQMNITSKSLGGNVGSIRYPSLRCGGELVLVEANESTWTMRENITYGVTNCITGGSITMESTGPGRARWLWYYPRGELGAQAEVKRLARER